MAEPITLDLILDTLQRWVEEKIPIGPATWLDAAAKMTVLVGGIQEEMFLLQQVVSKKKLEFIENGDSVAKAKVKIEGLDEYVQIKKFEAKIDRVTELVRISKLQARMSDDNMKNH